MDREAIRQALKHLVGETTGEACPELAEDSDLREGLGLDSVDMFSLVVDLQGHFQVKRSSDEMEPIQTVGQLVDVLQAKLAGKAPKSSAA